MQRQKFYKQLKQLVNQTLGDGYTITLCNFQKIGLGKQDAIIIKQQTQELAPVIYLKEYYTKFLNGKDMAKIAKEIIASYLQASEQQKESICDFTFLNQKNQVEQKLFFRCVNTEKNKENLIHIPHRNFLNLSLVYGILVKKEKDSLTSITMTEELMNYYGWNEETLFQLSMNNSCHLLPEQTLSMLDTLLKTLSNNKELNSDTINQMKKEETAGSGLMVISNSACSNGFASIFYPGVLAKLAEQKGSNLIIIPSSIHEAIVFADYGEIETEELNNMITEVNSTQVMEEEQLSDEAYYYERNSNLLFLIKDYKEGNRRFSIKI